MTVAALMLQGTGSDVGKSLLIAGLGRAYVRRGLRVAPFKPQNMSNNAAVTCEGGEIGRAQALQARACGLRPTVDMNPVLLKPQSDTGAQVVVRGSVRGNAAAREYQRLKPELLPAVLESFARLAAGVDLVLVEGAGSPAEVNLRPGDIANMGFAEAARVPVALVGDVDRGGAIAAIVGTLALLGGRERALVRGYVVNKFRGDVGLFEGAHAVIARHAADLAVPGLESFGVVPWFDEAWRLPAEDAVALERLAPARGGAIKVAVPRLARIANFDDLDPLHLEPDVSVDIVGPGRALPGDADLVLLPGSKSTLADLAFLREQSWDVDIKAHVRRGGHVLGICAGYQMLGTRISDPEGREGRPGGVPGLGLLDVRSEIAGDKTLAVRTGTELATGKEVRGYEMHMGRTTGPGLARPMLDLGGRMDGAVSADGRVAGCYVHGLFASDRFRHAYLARLRDRAASGVAYEAEVESALDALAGHLAAALDLDRMLEVARAR